MNTKLRTLRNMIAIDTRESIQGVCKLAHEILRDDYPMDDKIEALQKVHDTTGISEKADTQLVHVYIIATMAIDEEMREVE